ncbi:alanine racemase [Paenibacillus sp. GCM10027626]|uniref:alanine racemase n=1 Tax=Paenibacillus sp. GCM10027626 TaxID=3273411 RepID=UPI003634E237
MLQQRGFVEQLDTPAVVVDLDLLDANLRRTADLARKSGIKLRPHIKTHKSIWIAKKQLEYGSVGVTTAKLGEAEVMAAAGIDDILIAYPIVGKKKLERLGNLMKSAKVTVSTDNYEVAKGLSDLGLSLSQRVALYIDINTGLNRMGKEPGEESADLIEQIVALPGIEVTGIMTHSGHVYGKSGHDECRAVAQHEAESLVRTQQLLRERGIEIREVSVGSTPTAKFLGEFPGVTEARPGAYVYGDVSQIVTGTMTREQCALRIYATVVGKPRANTVVIDAGSKTLTTDVNPASPGYGILVDYPGVILERLSEEHGNLRVPDGVELEIGQVVEIIPNHCCTVVNLHDQLTAVSQGTIADPIRVDARGKIT